MQRVNASACCSMRMLIFFQERMFTRVVYALICAYTCESNKGHLSYVLYVKQGDRRFSLYVPDELADKIQQAIDNGRQLQDLIVEAGQRYTRALKTQRRS